MTVIIIISLIFVRAKNVADNATKIASASEIAPTEAVPPPTPAPTQRALDLVSYAMMRETDAQKAELKVQYGNKDMTDTELITAIALSADANPAQMASIEAYKEKETTSESRPVYYEQPAQQPVVVHDAAPQKSFNCTTSYMGNFANTNCN